MLLISVQFIVEDQALKIGSSSFSWALNFCGKQLQTFLWWDSFSLLNTQSLASPAFDEM